MKCYVKRKVMVLLMTDIGKATIKDEYKEINML